MPPQVETLKSVMQDLRRIETKGPAVDDLIHTHIVEPADEEQGLPAEEVLHTLWDQGSTKRLICFWMVRFCTIIKSRDQL